VVLGLTLLALVAGVLAVVSERHRVADAMSQIHPVTVVAALALVGVANLFMMLSWRALLAGLGSQLPLRAASRVFFQSQLGKYLPGSVWPMLAQVELGREHQVPARRSAVVSMLTLVLSVAGGLLVAALMLPLMGGAVTRRYWWTFLLAPLIATVLYPRVLNPLLVWAFRTVRRPPPAEPVTLRGEAVALYWILAAWLAYGLQVWVIMRDLGATQARALPIAIGAFALAWTVGFLVVIAPAGAGAREAVLVLALAPVLSAGSALVLAIISRALLTGSDFLLAGMVLLTRRRGGATEMAGAAEQAGQDPD
jgi:Uncharacterised protein family (UPF0104).